VLTEIDLTAELEQHERTGARATLALYPVDDPSAYGLVRRNPDLSVSQFLEKPRPEEIDTNLVNAGAYILERDVLDVFAPAGTNISIERDVFPKLVGNGLYGYEAHGYWMDIGTPERYLQATFDILEGTVETAIGARLREAGRTLSDGIRVEGRVVGPLLAGAGCVIGEGAIVGGRVALGSGVEIGAEARVESAALLDGARVGARSVVRSAILGPGAVVGEDCHVEGEVVLGAGVSIGAGNVLRAGARIFPGVVLPDGAIKF
jgi:mannose-1-phosphate guanylyltransferase